MWGNLKKENRLFPIVEFHAPDTLMLKGSLVLFETSLEKSYENGYRLENCDDPELMHFWKLIEEKHHG
ncbi:MAG: hypothetical protein PHX24_01395 [Acidithiobacillus sp.]|nr:hypothetical protein [Acidithiobacillus sp.]